MYKGPGGQGRQGNLGQGCQIIFAENGRFTASARKCQNLGWQSLQSFTDSANFTPILPHFPQKWLKFCQFCHISWNSANSAKMPLSNFHCQWLPKFCQMAVNSAIWQLCSERQPSVKTKFNFLRQFFEFCNKNSEAV